MSYVRFFNDLGLKDVSYKKLINSFDFFRMEFAYHSLRYDRLGNIFSYLCLVFNVIDLHTRCRLINWIQYRFKNIEIFNLFSQC